jgi:predicted signal transduction protein with EAL and GGDEF domain
MPMTPPSLRRSSGLVRVSARSLPPEGVETDERLAFLQRHHCDEAQGYYFSAPLDAQAFESLAMRGPLASLGRPQLPLLPAVV